MTIFRKDEFELCEVPVPEGYPQSQTHCGVICVDGSYILSTSPYPVPKRSKWLVYIMAVLKKISFGIYNPFYLNFPELTVMQNVIDSWNTATAGVVSQEKNTYFIPINDLLYKGSGDKQAVESGSTSDAVSNNLLYTEDHFHPNNVGYQLMADAVFASYKEVNQK